jgi:hypothetical protein
VSVLCAALVALGCGDGGGGSNESRYSGEKASVARVIDELGSASRDGDGRRICSHLLTANLAISIARAAKQPCAVEIVQQLFAEDAHFDIEDLGIAGKQATIRVKDQNDRESTLLLAKQKGRWRIARIGLASGR